MKGTEKQVKWAQELRALIVNSLEKDLDISKGRLERFTSKLEKNPQLAPQVKKLELFINAASARIEAVKCCTSAAAFIETRPNPTNGAEVDWIGLIVTTESVMRGDLAVISELKRAPRCLMRRQESEVLGYDYEEYIEKIKRGGS